MFGWLRNLTLTQADRRQVAISAYLDGQLTPAARRRFEAQLADDPDLQAEVAQAQRLRVALRQLPRRAAPRHFTLDPVAYGRPRPAPEVRLYPVVRTAAALAGFFFILSAVLLLIAPPAAQQTALAPANDALSAQEAPVVVQTTVAPEAIAEEESSEAVDEETEEGLRASGVGLSETQTITITANGAVTRTVPSAGDAAGILGLAPTEANPEPTAPSPPAAEATPRPADPGEAAQVDDAGSPNTLAPTPPPATLTPESSDRGDLRSYLTWGAGAVTLLLAALALYLRQRLHP